MVKANVSARGFVDNRGRDNDYLFGLVVVGLIVPKQSSAQLEGPGKGIRLVRWLKLCT